jgi:transcriptional regulator with XRE-family HTH domain
MIGSMRAATIIRQARRRAGLTQAELAARAGTTQSAIARWERGASDPGIERLAGLVAACGFELALGLTEPDAENVAALRRNLALGVDQRIERVVRLHNFVAAGREALATAAARG